MNETIGVIQPELGAGRFGPNAAWSDGEYLGQLELVAIVDSTASSPESCSGGRRTMGAYWVG